MRFRRIVAKFQIAQRKRKREKIARDTRRLGLERNKLLKDAKLKAKKAQATESKRQAELKKLRADEMIRADRARQIEARKKKAEKISKGIVKATKSIFSDLKKADQSLGLGFTKKKRKQTRK